MRDNADATLFWSASIARAALTGATIELPNEGGTRRVQLRPLPPDLVARYGLRRVAIAVAQWLAFELWLQTTLAYLQPVSAEAGAEAMRLVDGVWWNSRARLPDPLLVLRHNTDAGAELSPWVSRAYASAAMQAWVDRHCGVAEHPLALRRGYAIDGYPFADFATLKIDVHVPDPFPFPRAASTRITQEDFPVILEAVRRYAIERPGPDVLRPERSAE